ncbi:MAG: hypothetical protein K6E22_06245 [Treponema sp.]|nr:hypothetical protein [Treponema sp.]
MMNKINFFFILAAIFLILGCSQIEAFNSCQQEVEMEIPSKTVDADGKSVYVEFWNISFTDGINKSKYESLPSGSTIQVQVCKNRVASFLAEPANKLCTSAENDGGKGTVRASGAIFPLNKELSVQNGFAASVLYSLYEGSSCGDAKGVQEFLTLFNWQKFEQTCLEKSSDPWLLDKERIMRAISSGKFKKSDIRLK